MFSKMEQQIAKSELSLRGMSDRDRSWFQTMKQRKTRKDRLDQAFKEKEAAKNAPDNKSGVSQISKLSESKRKKKEDAEKKANNKTPSQIAKQKFIQAKERASLLRAKSSKTAHKQKRVRQLEEFNNEKQASNKNKRASKFSVDLTNTGRRNAKKLR